MNLIERLCDETISLTEADIAECTCGRLKSKTSELHRSIQGFFEDHHRFELCSLMRIISILGSEIGIISDRISWLMTSHNEVISRLEKIPGVGTRSAQIILSEVGYDLKTFPNTASFASWAGLCPGNNESAGKRKSGKTSVQKHPFKTIMVEVAWAAVRTKGCYYKDKYYRLRSRRGAKKAIIAIAHRIAKAIFYVIKHGEVYRELGEDYLKQKRQHKKLKSLRQQASALGLQLIAVEG